MGNTAHFVTELVEAVPEYRYDATTNLVHYTTTFASGEIRHRAMPEPLWREAAFRCLRLIKDIDTMREQNVARSATAIVSLCQTRTRRNVRAKH